jgi:sulfonate transport system ATP-binding protein
VSAPVVRVRGLVRRFTLRGVLNGLDLDIARGEFVALLGRSGSGKSTLLRALADLDHEAQGSGEIVRPERLSVVFQDARLLPWKRVLDNVVLGLDGADADARGLRALEEVELGGRARSWPYELSGGEQQRVALARSLVREPHLLLADEPFGALDALTRIRMHALLRRLSEIHNPAVLLVTHDVDEAIALADRVVVLEGGRLAANLITPRVGRRVDPDDAAALKDRLLGLLGVRGEDDPTPVFQSQLPPPLARGWRHPAPES